MAATTATESHGAGFPGDDRSSAPGLRDAVIAGLRKRDVQRMLVNFGVILALGTFVQLHTGLFFSSRNLQAISVQIVVVTVIACAMTLVMISGHIDLSVSGTVVLSGMVAGLGIVHGLPIWLAFTLATLSGVVVGLINSFLIIVVGITSFVATIGTLYTAQGVSALFTNGQPIYGLPLGFDTVGQGQIGGTPIAVPMILGVLVIFVAIQRFTVLGRYAVATGSNPQAAFLNGVNVRRTTTLCFVLSGAAAGWAGVVYASRLGNPAPTLDNDLLFQVIVAIVIGGTSLFGGEGSVFGTFLGSVLIGVLNNSLNLLGISTFWQYICLGALLVLSVGLDTVLRRDSVRRFRRSLYAVAGGRSHAGDPGGASGSSPRRSGLSNESGGGG
jgi:ribose/xylose/arabinose/galactoside ABC-type transport system permease subunit